MELLRAGGSNCLFDSGARGIVLRCVLIYGYAAAISEIALGRQGVE
jgi:hypothetical protein